MTDPASDFSSKVAANLIGEIFKSCLDGLKNAEQWLQEKKRQHDPFGLEASKYAARVEALYNSVKIMGMDHPVPLRHIYTRVNILRKITSRHRVTVDALEEFFDRDLKSFGAVEETLDGMSVVDSNSQLIILGKPGAGKTTFLKHVALQALDGKLERKRIPVFVSLKDWSDSDLSLLDYTVKQFDICGFPNALPFVEQILKKGKCLLLLDGLDEVSRNIDEVINQIQDFTHKYLNSQFVLSCRIAGYNYCFVKFTDVEIADFTSEQIKAFIMNWFKDEPTKANLCWQKLREDISISELATIPLLLTMLCIAFNETMDFPSNRAELYKEALDALLKKWDSSRSIKRSEIYRYLSLRRKESMLSRIAATTFEKDSYFIPQKVLESHIAEYIENLPEASQETLEPDSEGILKAIEAQHGLFVERANRIYSFSHLTLQEYFTARYLVDNAGRGSLTGIVQEYFGLDRWRECFLLVAGMLEDADEFLRTAEEKARGLKADPVTTLFLEDLSNTAGILGNSYSTPMIRALAISSAIDHFRTRRFSQKMEGNLEFAARVAQSIPISIAKDPRFALERDRSFFQAFANARYSGSILAFQSGKLSKNLIETAVQKIRALNLEFERARELDLNRRLANLLQERPSAFESYLKTTKLLVDCLVTQCYLSRDTRQEIYDRLLT